MGVAVQDAEKRNDIRQETDLERGLRPVCPTLGIACDSTSPGIKSNHVQVVKQSCVRQQLDFSTASSEFLTDGPCKASRALTVTRASGI